MDFSKRFLHWSTNWMKEKITQWDLYPKVVTFTYEGKSAHKSFIGGIISFTVQLITLIILISSTITVFQKGKSSNSINSVAKNLTNDTEKHYFAQNNQVYFALNLYGPNPEKILDESYISLKIEQKGYLINSQVNNIADSSKIIEYELCGDKSPIFINDESKLK